MPNTINNLIDAQPEINKAGKRIAGLMLILFTLFPIIFIIGFWPDRLPDAKQNETAWYTCKMFNVVMLDSADYKNYHKPKLVLKDTAKNNIQKDSIADTAKHQQNIKNEIAQTENVKLIHLNSLMLILIALMGFLGNMVHIAASFTSYIGNGTFKRSWILWYWVKPITAAGFAIIIYFVLRGGLLSYNAEANNFNLYGILALGAMVGLFTDSATLKLKEVFDVIFKAKDDRSDKLNGNTDTNDNNTNTPTNVQEAVITDVQPQQLLKSSENNIVVKGSNFTKAELVITIGQTLISTISKSENELSFTYTPSTEDEQLSPLPFTVLQNKETIYTTNLTFSN